MKKKNLLTLLALILIVAVCGFVFYIEKENVTDSDNRVIGTKQVTEYYVLVANYFSEETSFMFEDVKSRPILVLRESADDISSLGFTNIQEMESLDLLVDDINKNKALALIPWTEVPTNLKTLSIGDRYFWDLKEFDDYPLKVEKEISDSENFAEYDPNKVTKINFLGDIMLSRTVNTQMNKYGFGYPWEKTSATISNADITFANLEVPISDRYNSPASGMSFIASKENTPEIKKAGIDVVSVANNHSANFGYQVFNDNLSNLDSGEIGVCGGGINEAEARAAKVIEVNGVKFGFLCLSSVVGSLYADETGAGVPYLGIEPWYREDNSSIDYLKKDIARAKKVADVVVVSPHWGVEYKHYPNDSQEKVARIAIEAGADLVVGTHPHVVQSSEFYNGKYISYSLGNFIFDQEWSEATKQGVMLTSYFYEKRNVASDLYPLEISNYAQPKFVTGNTYNKIINTIKEYSTNLK